MRKRQSALMGILGLIAWGLGGTATSEPITLLRWEARPQELVLANDKKSGLLMAWTVQESSRSWVGVQRAGYDGDLRWGEAGIRLGSPAGTKQDVRLAADRHGGAIVLWREQLEQQTRFYLQKLSPRGVPRWPPTGILVASASLSSPIAMEVDEKGRIFMAWDEMEDGTSRIRCQIVDQEGRVLLGALGRLVATGENSLMAPAVSHDGEGGIFVVWQSGSPAAPRLLAQYLDSNHKPIWNPQGVVVSEQSSRDEFHASVYTPYDELVVIWSEHSTIGEIWSAQSLEASGQRQWGVNGISLTGEGTDQVSGSVAANHEGKITAAWEEAGQEPHAVYVQRWLRGGQPVWGFSGTGIVTSPQGAEEDPLVVTGSKDAYIFWWDNRNRPWELYAQRMRDDGTPAWHGGVRLALLGVNPTRLYGVPDSSAGAVVMWMEPTVSGSWQLQAARLNAAGSQAW